MKNRVLRALSTKGPTARFVVAVAVALAGAMAGACDVHSFTGPGTLASLTISPDPTTLTINGTQQYTAVGKDAEGNVVAIAPTWSIAAGGGTINSTGLFTAGTVLGTFTNTIQATSTLISAGNVVLIGSAQAKNVYWWVGSSATLDNGSSGSQWQGNILAQTTITINGNVTLLGRALARDGAVNLGTGNNITLP